MIAYKFLRAGRAGPFSGFRWPEPGTWVQAGAAVACRRGVHACRRQDLPWWLSDELWEIELGGEVLVDGHKVLAPAGRLGARLKRWDGACAQEYAAVCAWRARDRAAEALRRIGEERRAAELAACPSFDCVAQVTRQVARSVPACRISLTIARDGALRALSGAAPTSAYIAAHAALRLDGRPGYDRERAWQARWLVERLALRA